jgi:hypothetical protein
MVSSGVKNLRIAQKKLKKLQRAKAELAIRAKRDKSKKETIYGEDEASLKKINDEYMQLKREGLISNLARMQDLKFQEKVIKKEMNKILLAKLKIEKSSIRSNLIARQEELELKSISQSAKRYKKKILIYVRDNIDPDKIIFATSIKSFIKFVNHMGIDEKTKKQKLPTVRYYSHETIENGITVFNNRIKSYRLTFWIKKEYSDEMFSLIEKLFIEWGHPELAPRTLMQNYMEDKDKRDFNNNTTDNFVKKNGFYLKNGLMVDHDQKHTFRQTNSGRYKSKVMIYMLRKNETNKKTKYTGTLADFMNETPVLNEDGSVSLHLSSTHYEEIKNADMVFKYAKFTIDAPDITEMLYGKLDKKPKKIFNKSKNLTQESSLPKLVFDKNARYGGQIVKLYNAIGRNDCFWNCLSYFLEKEATQTGLVDEQNIINHLNSLNINYRIYNLLADKTLTRIAGKMLNSSKSFDILLDNSHVQIVEDIPLVIKKAKFVKKKVDWEVDYDFETQEISCILFPVLICCEISDHKTKETLHKLKFENSSPIYDYERKELIETPDCAKKFLTYLNYSEKMCVIRGHNNNKFDDILLIQELTIHPELYGKLYVKYAKGRVLTLQNDFIAGTLDTINYFPGSLKKCMEKYIMPSDGILKNYNKELLETNIDNYLIVERKIALREAELGKHGDIDPTIINKRPFTPSEYKLYVSYCEQDVACVRRLYRYLENMIKRNFKDIITERKKIPFKNDIDKLNNSIICDRLNYYIKTDFMDWENYFIGTTGSLAKYVCNILCGKTPDRTDTYAIYKYIKQNVVGGRTQIYERGYAEDLVSIDLNSLYATVQKFGTYPSGSPTYTTKYIPDKLGKYRVKFIDQSHLKYKGMAAKNEKTGVLDWNLPTIGEYGVTSIDIKQFDWAGIKYEIIDGYYYKNDCKYFEPYMDVMYKFKQFPKNAGEKEFSKLMLTSIYGKSLENIHLDNEGISNLISEDNKYEIIGDIKLNDSVSYYRGKLRTEWLDKNWKKCQKKYSIIGCFVLAYSRALMFQYIHNCELLGIKLYCQDTDSLWIKSSDFEKFKTIKPDYNLLFGVPDIGDTSVEGALGGYKNEIEKMPNNECAFLNKKTYLCIKKDSYEEKINKDVNCKFAFKGVSMLAKDTEFSTKIVDNKFVDFKKFVYIKDLVEFYSSIYNGEPTCVNCFQMKKHKVLCTGDKGHEDISYSRISSSIVPKKFNVIKHKL